MKIQVKILLTRRKESVGDSEIDRSFLNHSYYADDRSLICV